MAPPFHVIVPVITVFPLLSKLPPNTRLPLTVRSKAPLIVPPLKVRLFIAWFTVRLTVPLPIVALSIVPGIPLGVQLVGVVQLPTPPVHT